MSAVNKQTSTRSTGKTDWIAWFAVAGILLILSVNSKRVLSVPALPVRENVSEVKESMQVEIREAVQETPKPVAEPEPAPLSGAVKPDEAADDIPDEGQIIPISADYRKHLGFPGYVRQMTRLGGVFYLYDTRTDKIKDEVDPRQGVFSAVRMDRLKTMSARVREINGEVAVSEIIARAKQEYGAGQYSVILLIPDHIDEKIQANTLKALVKLGRKPSNVQRLTGEYRTTGESLVLNVSNIVYSNGLSERTSFSVEI